MILANLMVGFALMLMCLIVQAAVAFWSVRYYVRQSPNAAARHKFIASIRPLVVCMLAMLAGNFIHQLSHCVFDTIADIIDACCDAWNGLLTETGRIRSLCSYPWVQKVSA
jgi:hypothetical protein